MDFTDKLGMLESKFLRQPYFCTKQPFNL